MSKKEYQFIKPLSKKPSLKPKAKIQTKTRKAVDEFIESSIEYAEVTLDMPKSGTKGLLIGLNRAIGKERKDKYEARLTTDNKVVLIRKKV
jgi:hypothetical protein